MAPSFRQQMLVLLCLMIPLPTMVTPISFNFTDFGSVFGSCSKNAEGICFDGDAFVDSTGSIQLTNSDKSAGWAYFSEPLHLWNKTTNELTTFNTNFSFSTIRSKGGVSSFEIGGGIAFFLQPINSKIPPISSSYGMWLGLSDGANSRNSFVAVEFDSYNSSIDTSASYCHIGIDVNTVASSVVAVDMGNDRFVDGSVGDAQVVYEASTKNLSVLLKFNGSIHEMSYVIDLRRVLPPWVSVGFSGSTGQSLDMKRILSWDLESTLDAPVEKEKDTVVVPIDQGGGNSKAFVLAAEIGVPLLLVTLVLFWLVVRGIDKRRKGKARNITAETEGEHEEEAHHDEHDVSANEELDVGCRSFSYDVLATATGNFKEEHMLAQGRTSSIYKGFLRNPDRDVAIKKMEGDSVRIQFDNEINILSRLHHRNIIQIIGWCHEDGELLLVYEFMDNGSLDSHLFSVDRNLPWTQRYKIALRVATGLLYLHDECGPCIVHRDICSGNIMLDHEFAVCIGGFGKARLTSQHGSDPEATDPAGTTGYVAPECFVTKESDVYSFGVVALEIATGRRAIEYKEGLMVRLVPWVLELYGEGRLLEAADEKLGKVFDAREMERLLVVGLWCTRSDFRGRPSIRQARDALCFEAAALPDLYQNMPIPTGGG